MLSVSDTLHLAYNIKERFLQLLKIKDADTFIAKFREREQLSWLLILRRLIVVQIRLASGLILLLMLVSLGYSNGYAEECKYKYTTTTLSCFQYAIRYKNEPVKGFPFTGSIR